MKLLNLFRGFQLPTVAQTLNTFQKKINQLNARIDYNVDEINAIDNTISKLYDKKRALNAEIVIAEQAVEQLEKITG